MLPSEKIAWVKRVQILGKTVRISYTINTFQEVVYPTLLPPPRGK